MTYRDDRDADQARIQSLEGELVVAKRRIDELEGRKEQALVLASGGDNKSAAKRWLGAPTELEIERTFEGEFPAERFEDLVEQIRELTRDRGRTELMRSSVAWFSSSSDRGLGPFLTVSVTVKNGKTVVRVNDRLGQLAGAYFGGIGGGIGGGGLIAPISVTIAMPILAPLAFGVWFGSTFALARTLYKRKAKKRAEQLQQVFAALEAEVAKELRSPVERATDESRDALPGERQKQLGPETT